MLVPLENITVLWLFLESCVRSRLTYGTQAWYPSEQQIKVLEVCWRQCLRNMVKGGWKRRQMPVDEDDEVEADYSFVYSNSDIECIVGCRPLRSFIDAQYLKYVGHVCRADNNRLTKKMMFAQATNRTTVINGSKFQGF